MTKIMRRKPGPKSVSQSKIITTRGSLGESSTESDSNDSSPEQTLDNYSHQESGTLETRNTIFRTPDAQTDVTDYGLEFTTTNIPNPSPRRCSTLRLATSSQEESEGCPNAKKSNKENETLPSTRAKSAQKSKSIPLEESTKQQKNKSRTTTNSTLKEQNVSAKKTPVTTGTQVTRKPRKRRNPEQLEKRFWKDVKALQNRTDHLIPMLPFSRLVRELMHSASTKVTQITPTAMEALQTSSELYMTQRLQDAYMLTLHRGRVTLDVKDLELINYLKLNL